MRDDDRRDAQGGCQATNAGVNFVVAAGNEGWDFDFPSQPDLPAAYPQVLTVTAMADSDGKQGGTGPNTSCGSAVADDTRAGFSNFALTNTGRNHTIAAPGVCIKSTWKGTPNYNTISGTSMASPHMAAVVALCLGEQGSGPGSCAGKTPAQVISFLRTDAANYNNAHLAYGFNGDPNNPIGSRYYGFLTRTRPPVP